MSKKTFKAYIKDLIERAIKTFAEALVAAIGVDAATLGDVDWPVALSTAALATLVSVLLSIASIKVGDKGTASMV